MNQLNLDRLLGRRHKNRLHRPSAQASQKTLRLAQAILVPSLLIRQAAREELKGTKPDSGLGGREVQHGGEATVETEDTALGHGARDDFLDRHGLGGKLLRRLDVLRGEGAVCVRKGEHKYI